MGERLELDFLIDKLSVAVEVQGQQHFELVPMFHNDQSDLEDQIRRDGDKARICQEAGIKLLYIVRKDDISSVIYEIQAKIDKRLNDESWQERRSVKLINLIDRPMNEPRRKKKAIKKQKRKPIELPATPRTRKRGNKLSINQQENNAYQVSGGESLHVVTFANQTDFHTYSCDCRGHEWAKDGICSHIWAVFSRINAVYTADL